MQNQEKKFIHYHPLNPNPQIFHPIQPLEKNPTISSIMAL